MATFFNHEKLNVYQSTLQFINWAGPHIHNMPSSTALKKQLDRASTSITLNIAEGNGKWSPKDRCRFFDIAHGSALECAAALDIAVVKQLINEEQVIAGKRLLQEIVNMLIGLIKANDSSRMFKEDDGQFVYCTED